MGELPFERHAGQTWTRQDEVIYEIYPRSFKDSNGDGYGDIKGIISQLDYLASLHVDGLWLTPMYTSPPGAAGDGGYAVENHRSIDPSYGTMEDYEELVREAGKRGMKIYQDFVLPHTSHTHEWFRASRDPEHPDHEKYKDFYVWHPGHYEIDGKCMNADEARVIAKDRGIQLPKKPGLPNNWKAVFGGPAWQWDERREAFYLKHFMSSQPALELNNTQVQDALFDDMEFWQRKGVHFRLDSVPYANHDPEFRDDHWMRGYYPYDGQGWEDQYLSYSMCQDSTKDLIARLRERFPYATLFGEVIAGKHGGREAMDIAAGYIDAGLDGCYTNDERAIGSASADYLRGMLAHFEDRFPNGGLMYTVSDHDAYMSPDGKDDSPRAYTRVTRNTPAEYREAAYKQTLQLYATLRGTLSIYQGDELGLCHARIPEDIPYLKIQDDIAHTKGMKFCRDGARTPFPSDSTKKNSGFSESDQPYLPVPVAHMLRSVNMQDDVPNSTLNFTRELISWRKNQPALRDGKLHVLATTGDLLAFVREDRDQTLLCAFNMGTQKFNFRPADVLDPVTMSRLGLNKDATFVMEPYGYQFAGEMGPDHTHRGTHREMSERPKPERLHLVAA